VQSTRRRALSSMGGTGAGPVPSWPARADATAPRSPSKQIVVSQSVALPHPPPRFQSHAAPTETRRPRTLQRAEAQRASRPLRTRGSRWFSCVTRALFVALARRARLVAAVQPFPVPCKRRSKAWVAHKERSSYTKHLSRCLRAPSPRRPARHPDRRHRQPCCELAHSTKARHGQRLHAHHGVL
jgi:hypothetical protein